MPVRKRFGQHFLHDNRIIERIVDAAVPAAGGRLVEIGPGRGALTWRLLERVGSLEVIEIDRDLAARLGQDERARHLKIHLLDVLDADFRALRAEGPPLHIVGNLPYNISTPLMFRLLAQREAIADMLFMLQREVVDRMCAQPGSKAYGRLTVMLAASAEVEKLFDVGPGAFQPPPQVWSAVVRVRPAPGPRFDIGSDRALRHVVTSAFSQRRKTLRNALKGLLSSEDIESCAIDPGLRPEVLTPAQFGLLAARWAQLYSNRDDDALPEDPRIAGPRGDQ